MTAADLTPNEIAAALAARRELGPEYEDAIASSLADRVEREISQRVDATLTGARMLGGERERERRRFDRQGSDSRLIAVVSLIAGIPLTGIAAGSSHGNIAAMGVVWLGIAMVNMAHALGRRHR
jgi:hypothetical protein